MKRTLVTTALEETWPENPQEPVLFLGEWCRLYSRRERWSKMNAEVVPYHWDERKKIRQDYDLLTDLYEHLLNELTQKLNSLHEVKHSARYWRIVVGPWLGYFVQVVFDRWFMLREAIRKNKITKVRCILTSDDSFIPNDMGAFERMVVEDQWNQLICSNLIKFFKIPVEKVKKIGRKTLSSNYIKKNLLPSKSKRLFASLISRLSGALCRKNEHFLIQTYLPPLQEIRLQLKLRQTPKMWFSLPSPHVSAGVNSMARKWKSPQLLNKNNFSEIIRCLIPQHIPISYLEEYKRNVALTKSLPWPKQPKSILTSNSHFSDDVFKIWAAEKVEEGVPLFIGQHGGSYGIAHFNFCEDHEIKSSDLYLTFGWKNRDQPKAIPIGNLKESGKKINRRNPHIALLVTMSMPRYSYWMYSTPVAAGQWQRYFFDLTSFVNACSEDIKKSLLVRLYSQDYGNNQKERWAASCPEIKLDSGKQPIRKLLRDTKIYISTYNATTYLESLYHNIPTLIFWNPNNWELRDEAMPYFELLEEVGIFHKSCTSAADHLNSIWEHLEEWWQGYKIQDARAKFCNRFSRNISDPAGSLARELQKVKKI